jgi:hypothetical protein
MQYFKYLLFILLILITTSSYSAYTCGVGANVTLTTDLQDYPSVICANTGAGNCEVIEDHSIRSNDGSWIIYATSTGEGCITPTNLNAPPLDDGCERTSNGSIVCPEEQEEEEVDPVLQCSTDSCPNPENKRCPTGYTSGSFNGQNICAKSNTPPDPEPCQGDNCEPDQDVINAVNDANNSITNSINNLSNGFSNSFNSIKNLLSEISQKIQNLGNSNNNGDGDGDGDGDGEVDTSELSAEMSFSETDQHYLNENLFSSNDQCPADNVLNLNFMGNNITYNFSYAEICNALYSLSFIVMILAYMVSIYIVSRE